MGGTWCSGVSFGIAFMKWSQERDSVLWMCESVQPHTGRRTANQSNATLDLDVKDIYTCLPAFAGLIDELRVPPPTLTVNSPFFLRLIIEVLRGVAVRVILGLQ